MLPSTHLTIEISFFFPYLSLFYLFLMRILFHPLTPFQGKNDLGLDVMLPDRTAEFCISDESQKSTLRSLLYNKQKICFWEGGDGPRPIQKQFLAPSTWWLSGWLNGCHLYIARRVIYQIDTSIRCVQICVNKSFRKPFHSPKHWRPKKKKEKKKRKKGFSFLYKTKSYCCT